MNYSFNGVTKIITPTDAPVSGAITIDVQEIYSRWVDWLLTSDNSKYLLALRSVGGDPLPGSKKLGLTYFLMNGWKIRPYEADHVFTLNGNLYSEDGSSPFALTIGTFNVTIISSVSNLVDSTVQQLPEIEHNTFNQRVTIDVVNGVAGVAYPTGTPLQPVNNLTDAISIATTRGFGMFELLSDLTITTGQNVDEYMILSKNWLTVTIEAGVSLLNTNFQKVSLYGVMGGVWNVLIDCWAYDITNFSGWVRGGSIGNVSLSVGTLGFEFGGQSFFDDLVPLYPDTTSILTMNTDTSVSITNCADIVTLKSLTIDSTFICGLSEGVVIVDATCTGGDIAVSGIGLLTNNSAVFVDSTSLMNQTTVADAVLDEPLSEHQATGTIGKTLRQIKNTGEANL